MLDTAPIRRLVRCSTSGSSEDFKSALNLRLVNMLHTKLGWPSVLVSSIDSLEAEVMEVVDIWWSRMALARFRQSLRTRTIEADVLMMIMDQYVGDANEDEWEDVADAKEASPPAFASQGKKGKRRRRRKKGRKKRGRFPGNRDEAEQFLKVEVVQGSGEEEGDPLAEALCSAFTSRSVGCILTGRALPLLSGPGEVGELSDDGDFAPDDVVKKKKKKTRGEARNCRKGDARDVVPEEEEEEEAEGEGEAEGGEEEKGGDVPQYRKKASKRTVERALIDRGYEIIRRKKHIIWRRKMPNRRKQTITISATPSDWRTYKNQMAQIKRNDNAD
jgi:hypothetical protein